MKTQSNTAVFLHISFKDKNLYVPFYPHYGDHNYFQITDKINI